MAVTFLTLDQMLRDTPRNRGDLRAVMSRFRESVFLNTRSPCCPRLGRFSSLRVTGIQVPQISERPGRRT